MDSCTKHAHEHGTGICRRCGMPWCDDCLVYVYGPKKPPYCIGCAMFAGGVRTTNVLPAMSRREVRAKHKAAKAAAKAAKRSEHQDDEHGGGSEELVDEHASSPATADDRDWSTPWWEPEREPTLTD